MRRLVYFKDVIPQDIIDKTDRSGRSDALLNDRNCCLLARYYYYMRYKEKCYEEILDKLVDEFFLSAIRINRLIQQNVSLVKKLKDNDVSLYQLKNHWPQFKW
jgi:hypothetical protein